MPLPPGELDAGVGAASNSSFLDGVVRSCWSFIGVFVSVIGVVSFRSRDDVDVRADDDPVVSSFSDSYDSVGHSRFILLVSHVRYTFFLRASLVW